MPKFLTKNVSSVLAGGTAIALLSGIGQAYAQDDMVSASAGYNFNTHFVSYGADVWGAGNAFYGSQATSSIWTDVAFHLADPFTINVGAWSDINNNVPSGIGGSLQEVDVYIGGTYSVSGFSFGATYQAWSYAGDVEQVVDVSLAYDDTGMIAEGFALMPKVVLHNRVDGNGSQQLGSAVVVSVGPSFKLTDDLSLTIPAGIAFFTTDDFQGGWTSGYGYSYVGGSLGYALSFIPPAYGAWSVNFDLIGYFTKHSAIPNNPKASFLTGQMGIKVAF